MAEKIFDNNFNSTELTKINININDAFASKDDELHHIRLQCQEYMDAQNFDEFIFIKYTHKKQLHTNATNKIFLQVVKEFSNMLSFVEIFSVICDHFEIDSIELFNQLSQRIQNKLKMELVESTNYTYTEMFCQKANNGLIMPSL